MIAKKKKQRVDRQRNIDKLNIILYILSLYFFISKWVIILKIMSKKYFK